MPRGLTGTVVPVGALTAIDRSAMFTVFHRYYADVTRARFEADLSAKDDVIVLRDPAGTIRGFSTLLNLTVTHDGRVHHGVFSGDTVVDEPFWGTKVLGRVFLRYLFAQRLRRPWAPLWWFLISKGYKTYLLMANNFPEHWPRHEQPTPPHRQALLDAFATQVFATHYDAQAGLIRLPEQAGRLRDGVGAVTEALGSDHPRVRYFIERNPRWAQGEELVCIANMSWSMPARYALKALRDRLGRRPRPSERRAA